MPAITQQYAQEGAGGSVQLKGAKAGEAPVTTNYAGQGPANICIKPLPASGAMPVATSCKSNAPDVKPGSLRYVSVCSGMKLDTTIRKVDATTWEFRSVILYSGAPMAGQQDFSGMRRMLAAQVKTGATAQERSDAAAALAQMGVYEAEMKKNAAALKGAQAEAEEQGGGGGAVKYTKQQTVVQRLTRLADSCVPAGVR